MKDTTHIHVSFFVKKSDLKCNEKDTHNLHKILARVLSRSVILKELHVDTVTLDYTFWSIDLDSWKRNTR